MLAPLLLSLLLCCKAGPLYQTGPFGAEPFPDPLSIAVVGDPGFPDEELFQQVGILDDAYSTWCVKLEEAFQDELGLQRVTCMPLLHREGLSERPFKAGSTYDVLYLPADGTAFPFLGRWPSQILFIDHLRLRTASQLMTRDTQPHEVAGGQSEDARADLTTFAQQQGYVLQEALWEVGFSVTWWDNQQGALLAYDELHFQQKLEGTVLVGKHLDHLARTAVQQMHAHAPRP